MPILRSTFIFLLVANLAGPVDCLRKRRATQSQSTQVSANTSSPLCSAHPGCAHLSGNCCPTHSGMKLDCCGSAPATTTTPSAPDRRRRTMARRRRTAGSPGSGGKTRLLSFNIWYGNNKFNDIAKLINNQVKPDIANLQEAINHQPAEIVKALNAQGEGEWKLANPFNRSSHWCGLNVYRSDKWELEWTKSLPYQGDRGVCGARLRRKSDGKRLCVWGTHPIYQHHQRLGGNPKNAQEAVRTAASAMQECSRNGAASAFLCDCNTLDTNAVESQLKRSTGWGWTTAHADQFDHIYLQTSPQNAGSPSGGTTIAGNSGRRMCQRNCQNPRWAYSDHPPVYVDVV